MFTTNDVYQAGINTTGDTIGTPGTSLNAGEVAVAIGDVLYLVATQVGNLTVGADLRLTVVFG